MLVLGWEYLTGRAVARNYAGGPDGGDVEWPPEPDRVFQALTAAWGGLGKPEEGKKALEWLERQGNPEIWAEETLQPRVQNDYVPVNDASFYKSSPMRDLPLGRERKPRTFPSAVLPQPLEATENFCAFHVLLVWPEAVAGEHLAPLGALCAATTHIGHSRSLVRLVAQEGLPEGLSSSPRWRPSEGFRGERVFRVPCPGRLEALQKAHGEGKRPPVAPYGGYARGAVSQDPEDLCRGIFDEALIILRRRAEDRPSVVQTLAFTDALRKTLISHVPPAGRELVSGHREDGSPAEAPHLAYLPLPFAGAPHADGHVLGFALALPRLRSPEAEDALWESLERARDPESGDLRLRAGRAGSCVLTEILSPAPPRALLSETWCGASRAWGTVTPFVLDRLPPRRHGDRDAWAEDQVRRACARQNLPEPQEVALSPVSVWTGIPPAREFPPLCRKDGVPRWHIHVAVTFRHPVAGPLVLGGGRFQGYGLFKPLKE